MGTPPRSVEIHWKALKRVLIYLNTTRDIPLVFGAHKKSIKPDRALRIMVDADHGGCVDTRRSTSGIYIRAFGDTVLAKSKRQGRVSHATGSAEFNAIATACRKARNLLIVMEDLGFPQRQVLIESDSQVAVDMLKKGRLTEASKHHALDFYEAKEMIDSGVIVLRHVPGDDNTSDILTKPLPGPAFEKHARSLLHY